MKVLSLAVLISLPAGVCWGACPSDMVEVTKEGTSYCVDIYEGSLMFLEDGNLKAWEYNKVLKQGTYYRAVSLYGSYPQGYISAEQAAEACQNAEINFNGTTWNKRLCTLAEWIHACKGSAGTTYPYSSTFETHACNEHYCDSHSGGVCQGQPKEFYMSPMCHFYPSKCQGGGDWNEMNDPRHNKDGGFYVTRDKKQVWNQTLALTGSFSKCKSNHGAVIYDMVGNLHEWVSDRKGSKGIFKGGYYNEAEINGSGCNYTTSAHIPAYHDYSTGFRCCADSK